MTSEIETNGNTVDERSKETADTKKCCECSRDLPLSEYKIFQSSGKVTSMCHKCREVKAKYMKERRSRMTKAVREKTTGESGTTTTGYDGAPSKFPDDELTERRPEPDKNLTDLPSFIQFLITTAEDDGKLVNAQFTGYMTSMASYNPRDGDHTQTKQTEKEKEAIILAKQQLREYVANELSGEKGYTWRIYRLTTAKSVIHMTLHCSDDVSRVRASISQGKRKKKTKKTEDCKSQIYVSYNCNTQLLKIVYKHINHQPSKENSDKDQVTEPQTKKAKNPVSKESDIAIVLEDVDPTITAIHAQEQAKQEIAEKLNEQTEGKQYNLRRILN